MVLGLGRPEGMPRASSSAELMDAAATALARLRGGRSACAIIFSSRTTCEAAPSLDHETISWPRAQHTSSFLSSLTYPEQDTQNCQRCQPGRRIRLHANPFLL